jgi:hypothetical protein
MVLSWLIVIGLSSETEVLDVCRDIAVVVTTIVDVSTSRNSLRRRDTLSFLSGIIQVMIL